MDNGVKVIMAVILVIGMIVVGTYIYQNKENLFKSQTTITYPDRCVEQFDDDKLVSDECTYGRMLMEQQQQERDEPAFNIQWNNSNKNLT